VRNIVIDKKNLLVTTPAFMYDKATFADIFNNIDKLVQAMKKFKL
jgi:enhancing lycopene biosynthesis protein 2